MTRARAAVGVVAIAACVGWQVLAQGGAQDMAPVNDLPNPYRTITDYFKLPAGRTWGSTATIDIDKDGSSVWIAERCGANTCFDPKTRQMSNLDPILHFDATGRLIKSFGAGLLVFPHGIFVDRDGNVWITDGNDDAPPAPAAAAGGGTPAAGAPAIAPTPPGPRPGATRGHQVLKFSPDGKLLMTLGKPGGAVDPDYFYQPNDVLVAPNGDIFVSQIHSGGGSILKFDRTGKFLKKIGKFGSAPGEFDIPHALAMDSRGRLFVGDRNNNRIQILTQDGAFIDQWRQFSRPSGLFIDKADNLYVVDSESGSVSRNHDGWKRGMRIGSAKDGSVVAFIPDPETRTRPEFAGTSAAEGVAIDKDGNLYGAEVGPKDVKKYVRK